MAPKKKKGGESGKSKAGEEERDEPLQAVIIADDFQARFRPFTLERPRCLLTLANTPLIEYTCEFLASAGVEEVFLYCGNHTDQVEDYLKNSRWTQATSPFSLEVIRSPSTSVGDCMRDLDQKQLITGDFVCVYGDVVANISLEAALAAHKARREKNKNAIMTMVLREAGDYHRTKSQHMRQCFVIDSETERCVHYEQVRPRKSPRLNVPEEVLKDHVEIDVREDLIDCGIDICTPDALAQWSDSFDWKTPRQDFLHGVLQDFETFQRTIHTHVLTEGYAARVRNLQAYDAISKDAVSRWTYPLCPDTNLMADQSYLLQKGHVYKEDGVALARSSTVSRKSVVGHATSVGEGSTITNSVIGRRCIIGKRARIEGAYVWDDARIGDDAIVERAIVSNEASIGKSCHIKPGALISYGVTVGNNTTVDENKRISKLKRKRGQNTDSQSNGSGEREIVGHGGDGYELEVDHDEEDVVEALLLGIQNMDFVGDGEDASDFESDDDEDEEDDHRHHQQSSRSASFGSIGSEDSGESGETRRNKADFHHEASFSIFDSLQKNEDPDTIQLELKTLRMASNAEDNQVRRAVAVAFSKRIVNLIESGKTPNAAVQACIPRNQRLISACVKEVDEQAEFLLYLQTDLVHRPQGSKVLLFTSNALATGDLVEGEGFEQWWNDERSSASEELKQVRAETKKVVDALAEDDEDDDDEEDSDEEEESEDDD